MRRAVRILPNGAWATADRLDTVALPYDDRLRRRCRLLGQGGTDILLDLARAALMQDGDALDLDGGGVIAVKAAPEPLMEARAEAGDAMVKLAWHVGNRHLPAELSADAVRMRWDPVIADMLTGLGATVHRLDAPFQPEGGAYAQGGRGYNDHDHVHGPTGGHGHP